MNPLLPPTRGRHAPRTLLSAEQRTRLFSIPIDTAEVTRHYVLDADDLALIGARRRASNRLGFAVQFSALRYPGRVPDPSKSPPVPMLAFVAKQIGLDPALFGEYARRAETRREHLLELQRLLRLPSFGLADWRACLRVGTDAAWATDRPRPNSRVTSRQIAQSIGSRASMSSSKRP